MEQQFRVIISGGDNREHIVSAIFIANEIKSRYPNTKILFVGDEHLMEKENVPESGYEMVGLSVVNFNQSNFFSNTFILIDYLRLNKVVNKFKPNIVIGVGGYVSFLLLGLALKKSIPTLMEEQNLKTGIINKVFPMNDSNIYFDHEKFENVFSKENIVDKIELLIRAKS